ncbi:WYL domain-containing transcriptional regulator [Methylomarinum sp. Ch1-1]|uniref:WYL domain-containing transcriptional regulator n=1 Tax=Methylomarinum roseum TaxID=3067653 RepID=A0AAU7NZV1_9GAMM|nr:WYL domain-containing transcriptional regulator [Methylomarinum sp. Ch1-1]MDP4521386.1 WYL domain-containing transcriptional regulator [Methylomarinum sp. Ch1-1]
MDKFNRIWQLHQEFSNRRLPVKLSKLAELLECSEKTIQRTLKQMQLELNAPLEYTPEFHGWRYTPDRQDQFELPGLWMNESELVSLILLLSILETFGNGLLNREMQRANVYITKLLSDRGLNRDAMTAKLKVLPIAQKTLPSKTLYTVSEALFKNRQVAIDYTDFNNRETTRTISPQTLVYYRDNWYVDAWCHLRSELRTFSIARITAVSLKNTAIKPIGSELLSAHFSESYGIFAGQPTQTAKLKFSPKIAREIAMQCWHEKQKAYWDGEHYLLEIPYGKSEELIMDIMRYLPDIEVLGPADLKDAVKSRIQRAHEIFCS